MQGTSNFTVRVTGAGGAGATKALAITVTASASAEDWAHPMHDAGHSRWAPQENVITPATAATVREEWSSAEGLSAIPGNRLYVAGRNPQNPDERGLAVHDLTTGSLLSQRSTAQDECS